MTDIETKVHPTEVELADFMDKSVSPLERQRLEKHLARCDECLNIIVSAYDSVRPRKKERKNFMKKINLYLLLAMISFTLSFVTPRYFIQLLVATLILGIKWVVDSKSAKMLVMIYEAWKKGGEKEASRILEKLESGNKRF